MTWVEVSEMSILGLTYFLNGTIQKFEHNLDDKALNWGAGVCINFSETAANDKTISPNVVL